MTRKIELSAITTVVNLQQVAVSAILTYRDNRTLGNVAARLMISQYGGHRESDNMNVPTVWVRPGGQRCSLGTGDIRSAFTKSACKGAGRGGNELKVPDADFYIHLEVSEEGSLNIRYYTIDDLRTLQLI